MNEYVKKFISGRATSWVVLVLFFLIGSVEILDAWNLGFAIWLGVVLVFVGVFGLLINQLEANLRRRQTKLAQAMAKHQKGQAIILIALMIVALGGITGLAIDGGGLYFLHRDTQNAVDAAVLAATYAKCTADYPTLAENNASIRNAAFDSLHANSYDQNRGGVTIRVIPNYNPYLPGDGLSQEVTEYVKVIVRATKPSYFIQLVYPAPLSVTSSAVGHCDFAHSAFPGLPEDREAPGIKTYPPLECRNNDLKLSGSFTLETDIDGYSVQGAGPEGTISGTAYFHDELDFSPGSTASNIEEVDYELGYPEIYSEEEYRLNGSAYADIPDEDITVFYGDQRWNGTPRDPINLHGVILVLPSNGEEGSVTLSGTMVSPQNFTLIAYGSIHVRTSEVEMYSYLNSLLFLSFYEQRNCSDQGIQIDLSSVVTVGDMVAFRSGFSASTSSANLFSCIFAAEVSFSASGTYATCDGSDGRFNIPPFLSFAA